MAQIVVRNLPDDVHKALKRRAARETGGSVEALVRHILSETVETSSDEGFGDRLRALWGGLHTDALSPVGGKEAHEPIELT